MHDVLLLRNRDYGRNYFSQDIKKPADSGFLYMVER